MSHLKEYQFPAWWVRTKCKRITNQYRKRNDTLPPIIFIKQKWNWSDACRRGYGKIKYRYYHPIDKQENEKWDVYLTHQLINLERRFHPISLWAYCEYENCKKVNKSNFGNPAHDTICHFVAIEVSKEFSKRMRRSTKPVERNPATTWSQKIQANQAQLNKRNFIEKTSDYWVICWRNNRDKLLKDYNNKSWGGRYRENHLKLMKMARGN